MKRHLNLMSQRALRRETIRRSLRLWVRVIVAVVLVLAPVGLSRWLSCHREQQRRTVAELQYEPIRRLRSENSRMKKRIETLQSDEQIPLALARERPVISLIGLASRAVAERGGTVYLERLELEQNPIFDAFLKRQESALVLEGTGLDATSVADLADSLRADGPFKQVEVDASETNGPGTEKVQQFTIECVF